MRRSHVTLALLSLIALTTVAHAEGLAPTVLVDKMPFRFVVDENARPSPLVDAPDAVARRAFTLTAKQERGAPLVFTVTMITYPTREAATVRRMRIEDQATRLDRDRSLPPLPGLGKEWEMIVQKDALLVQATASCSLSAPYVRAFQQRLTQLLGPLGIGPMRCSCGGACVVEK